MFMTLGLLSFPGRLLDVAGVTLLVAAVLIFVARPIAVFLCASWFRFSIQELFFLSWVGLKGAVPITLATFPMLAGLPGASVMFDTVFIVVLVSALIQGWTLPATARFLKLVEPEQRSPPVTLEISSLRDDFHVIVTGADLRYSIPHLEVLTTSATLTDRGLKTRRRFHRR